MKGVVIMRELVGHRRAGWLVEGLQANGARVASPFRGRAVARAYAKALAQETGAVIVLAGPSRVAAPLKGWAA